jgi:hypothetical protein
MAHLSFFSLSLFFFHLIFARAIFLTPFCSSSFFFLLLSLLLFFLLLLSGTAVTFFTPRQQYDLENIERRAKIKFIRIHAPAPLQLIQATIDTSITKINDVGVPLVCVCVFVSFFFLFSSLFSSFFFLPVCPSCLSSVFSFFLSFL